MENIESALHVNDIGMTDGPVDDAIEDTRTPEEVFLEFWKAHHPDDSLYPAADLDDLEKYYERSYLSKQLFVNTSVYRDFLRACEYVNHERSVGYENGPKDDNIDEWVYNVTVVYNSLEQAFPDQAKHPAGNGAAAVLLDSMFYKWRDSEEGKNMIAASVATLTSVAPFPLLTLHSFNARALSRNTLPCIIGPSGLAIVVESNHEWVRRHTFTRLVHQKLLEHHKNTYDSITECYWAELFRWPDTAAIREQLREKDWESDSQEARLLRRAKAMALHRLMLEAAYESWSMEDLRRQAREEDHIWHYGSVAKFTERDAVIKHLAACEARDIELYWEDNTSLITEEDRSRIILKKYNHVANSNIASEGTGDYLLSAHTELARRAQLNNKTVPLLEIVCRENKAKYEGYAGLKKQELIQHILDIEFGRKGSVKLLTRSAELHSYTVAQMQSICRANKALYEGFTKEKLKEKLVTFMLKKEGLT